MKILNKILLFILAIAASPLLISFVLFWAVMKAGGGIIKKIFGKERKRLPQ